MSDDLTLASASVELQYKYQLRGAILVVAFQLFAISFIYLMSWNYKLLKTSLTPMFWSVLFAVALHTPKKSMVHSLLNYDERLRSMIQPKIASFKKDSKFFWWLPTFLVTILYRILYFWKPIFFVNLMDVVVDHVRRYSVDLSSRNLFARQYQSDSPSYSPSPNSPNVLSPTSSILSHESATSLTPEHHGGDDVEQEEEQDDDSLSELSADSDSKQAPSAKKKKRKKSQTSKQRQSAHAKQRNRPIRESVGKSMSKITETTKEIAGGGAKKVFRLSVWLMSPTGLFCSVFVALCAILLNAEVVETLGLYTLIANLFVIIFIVTVICAIFVLIPSWSKQTYNTVVVIFLILTLIGASTLISGVILFKIADEITRFVSLMNQVVNNSEVFKNLHMDSYVNATSAKLLDSLHIYLGSEIDPETFQKIWANDEVDWSETFTILFSKDDESANNHTNNNTVSIQTLPVSETDANYTSNATDVAFSEETDEGGVMTELYKIGTADFDLIRLIKTAAKSVFGEQAWLKAVIDLDFQAYIEKAQEWGFDLPFINKILLYTQQFTSIVSTNLFSIIGLLFSFSGKMINLGLDFMVFLACLFYLLVESDALEETIKKITSIIPSDQDLFDAEFDGFHANENDDTHFLHSLFKSIQDIFVVTFEIFLLHAFVTWFTFTMFGVDFSFSTAFTSGIFSIIPYFPPWLVCLHGVIYLIYQHEIIKSLIMLAAHFALLWIDPILMERIENSHPYLTATSIVLGLTQFGLNGAIIGPLLVVVTSWSLKVIAFYCKHFATVPVQNKSPKSDKKERTSISDLNDPVKRTLDFDK